jgi:hypothetical protein
VEKTFAKRIQVAFCEDQEFVTTVIRTTEEKVIRKTIWNTQQSVFGSQLLAS